MPKTSSPRKRPHDLLKATAVPIHPFDEAHGTDTSGLIPSGHLATGHPNDAHITAYYGVAPSILRTLIQHWRETIPPTPSTATPSSTLAQAKAARCLSPANFLSERSLASSSTPPWLRLPNSI